MKKQMIRLLSITIVATTSALAAPNKQKAASTEIWYDSCKIKSGGWQEWLGLTKGCPGYRIAFYDASDKLLRIFPYNERDEAVLEITDKLIEHRINTETGTFFEPNAFPLDVSDLQIDVNNLPLNPDETGSRFENCTIL